MSNLHDAVSFIEFGQCAEGGRSIQKYWDPDRSGDYAKDCLAGRRHAEDVLKFASETGNVAVLPWIIAAMPRDDDMSGVEIGFLTALAEAAANGSTC